jgi:hypothetical protein
MDVRPPLIAHRQPAVARKSHASVRSTTHLCRPNLSLESIPRRAIRAFMPLFLKASRHRGKS